MIIKRHIRKENGTRFDVIVRYLRGSDCYLLIEQAEFRDLWSECFISKRAALKAFDEYLTVLAD